MSRKSRAEADAALPAAGETVVVDAVPVNRRPTRRAMAAILDKADPGPSDFAPPTAADLTLDQLCPSPLNPRRQIDEEALAPLADSIVANGILQALLVRPVSEAAMRSWVEAGNLAPSYEIICGARRHTAALLAYGDGRLDSAMFRMPVRIRNCSDGELVMLAATENLARADMHPLDEAAVFQAMRPHVKPAEGQTVETAIGKALGVSERTVFRRLALLRCAPEVQEALREKKITLAHAQAYSLGAPERQRDILEDHLSGGENSMGEPLRAEDIKYELTETEEAGLIPVERAIFDPADYPGEIVDDPETGERYFSDRGEFERLNDKALLAKVDALSKQWPWVDIDRRGWLADYQTTGFASDDPALGAVIRMRREGGIQIVAPALRNNTLHERRDAAFRDRHERRDAAFRERHGRAPGETPPAVKPAEAGDKTGTAPRPPLSQAQLERLHEMKSQALRRAVIARRTHDGRVPIALACLGLLGAREIRGMARKQEHIAGYGERVHPVDSPLADTAAIDQLLKTASLDLPPKLKWKGDRFNASFDRDSEAAAAWFGALMRLPTDDLYELHARLVAERIGSWLPIDKPDHSGGLAHYLPRLGDSPLASAIATYAGATEDLADIWQVDRDWMAQYGRDRLWSMAQFQCHISNANRLKKGELLDVVMEQPKGFWTASLFPEARFQTEKEAEKALAEPLPQPRGSLETLMEASGG